MAIAKKTAPAAPAPAAKKAAPAKNTAPAAPAKNTTVVRDGKKTTAAPKAAAPAEVVVEGNVYRKADIAEYLQSYVKADGKAIPVGIAKLCVEAYEQFIGVCLRDGDSVATSLGKFFVTDVPERQGRNPATGEEITIPARRQPKLKISGTLKKLVNGEEAAEGDDDPEGEAAEGAETGEAAPE